MSRTTAAGIPAPGITVIEASAGTGKTHRVTSLAVEALAEGLPVESLLLVTFTRAATGELRDRVWQRLVATEADLRAHLRAGAVPTDETSAALCDADAATVARRHQRIAAVVAQFDAATIATIHGFCEQVLSRVGFAGDVERDITFLEDPRDLTDQVVDDLLVQRFHKQVAFDFPRDAARRIAEAVITNPHARIVPTPDDPDRRAAMQSRFAAMVRERLERRKRELRVLSYDDLLTRLEQALAGPQGEVVRRRLHEQYRLVVVDEFQDTDAVQWNILRDAFLGSGSDVSLVLVGDPKQAIYAFRGADVHAYLAARTLAGDARTDALRTNWRSDADLLRGLDALFGSATLGHPDIGYRTTQAAEHHREPGLVGGRRPTAVRLRHVRRDVDGAVLTPNSGDLQMDWARAFVARDLATEIVQQLDGATRATRVDRRADGTEERRPVRPGDIAVLVQRHKDADLVRGALADVGVPTVVNGAGSVFDTAAAQDWLALLEAIEQPAASTRVRSAAMTAFFGWSAEDIATADDAAWDRVHGRLGEWRRLLLRRGVAALFEQVQAGEDLPARLLGVLGGERALTDLRHVAELLHEHGSDHDTAPATLVAWLRERIRRCDREADAEALSRRLETDAEAVQIWTIHRSKGLEFPIVHVPFLWRAGWIPDDAPPLFHDGGERCIDVGGARPGWGEHVARHVQEVRGEELRLAYVALTRARHQVVLWWASTYGAFESPLGTLLFGQRSPGGAIDKTPDDDRARTALDVVAQQAGGALAIEQASGGTDQRWSPGSAASPTLDVRRFDRTLDGRWRRTSYSALTALAHEVAPTTPGTAAYAPEHDDRGIEDERMLDEVVPRTAGDDPLEKALRAVPSPFGDTGGGARFGTLVHAVLEHTDFTAPDLAGELRSALAEQHRSGLADVDTGALLAGLEAAVETPLGPLVDDLRLRDVTPRNRLDELHFELPLVGGDRPSATLTVAAIADVVARTLPADDVLAGYHEHLRGPELEQSVRGYLSGSIDLVLRTGTHPGTRFVVIDHKSNWLGVPGEELSAWHYRPAALRDAMVKAHYPLQAMLYAVALHRYLRWRLPGYDPDTHLGGVLYLFLRGMTGPDVPRVDGQPCGVFSWRPPAALVTGLSDVLDAGADQAGAA
ncbi:MAG TPA: UvrD-helicase domain-containing protein [Acidimicrobiales bacterium]|nr:UvrD-helicase domain-containing protein [Acidimicrobiales bacterium]